MLKIEIYRNSDGNIFGFDVQGHHGEYGNDIICAGVSSLTQTALKGVGQHLKRKIDYQVASGDLHMKLKDSPDELTNAILETMLIGLYDIQKYDLKEVKIKEVQEV